VLNINKLSVIYPDKTQAVDGISLTINDNESVALIGANGAGKTSLIMAVMGVIQSQGDVAVNGIRLAKETLHEIRSRVGVVFQNPDDQLFMSTIFDDIAFGLRNIGTPEDEVLRRVKHSLTKLHIEHLEHKTALKLSGGEKRMAALATVLTMEPSVMIFDEPTAFLDPKARRTLINTLNSLPHTKLIATHDLAFALETCKRAVLMKNGHVFADGLSAELLHNVDLMDECGVEAI
jgi:cobalt/nickel transport system ATP-binding protein